MTHEDLVRKVTEVEQREKSSSHRIDNLETDVKELQESNKAIYQINANIEKICTSMSYTNKKLDENTEDIKSVKKEIADVKAEPIKRRSKWIDAIIQIVLAAVTGGVIGFILREISPTIWG